MSETGRLAFVISNNHCMIPDQFFWSYLRMMKPNGSFAVKGSSSVKASCINDGIYQAIRLGAEWMFLMDVDQLFPVYTIPRLFETAKKHDAKVVSVLYHLGRPPFGPVAGWVKADEKGDPFYCNRAGLPWKDNYTPLGEGVVDVDWTGAGGLLIHKDVVTAIGWPVFEDIWHPDQGLRICGHDVNFCLRAKDKGFKVLVDTSVMSDHGKFTYFGTTWAEAFTNSNMGDHMGESMHRQALERDYWDTVWQTEFLKNQVRDKSYESTHKDISELIKSGEKVADLGCGPGVLLDLLAKQGAQVTGYDFSDEAVTIVKGKGYAAHVADFRTYSPNGDAGQYDVVVSTHTIEHLKDDKQFVKTVKALLKPGGRAIIATPWREEVQGHFEHVRGYTEEDLRDVLLTAFKKVDVRKNDRDFVAVAE